MLATRYSSPALADVDLAPLRSEPLHASRGLLCSVSHRARLSARQPHKENGYGNVSGPDAEASPVCGPAGPARAPHTVVQQVLADDARESLLHLVWLHGHSSDVEGTVGVSAWVCDQGQVQGGLPVCKGKGHVLNIMTMEEVHSISWFYRCLNLWTGDPVLPVFFF